MFSGVVKRIFSQQERGEWKKNCELNRTAMVFAKGFSKRQKNRAIGKNKRVLKTQMCFDLRFDFFV